MSEPNIFLLRVNRVTVLGAGEGGWGRGGGAHKQLIIWGIAASNIDFNSLRYECCTVGCTKKHNNMCWQLFPILLEPLSKNMPLKMSSDCDISNM
jgi:hypothetical protein